MSLCRSPLLLRICLAYVTLGVITLSFAPAQTVLAADDRPNIVVLLADDMGWTGPASYGGDLHETPRIDRLVASGMKFTSGYAACTVCSPTRASIMTGKYPARLHLTDWITGQKRPRAKLAIPRWTQQLALEETTIAEALQKAGYKTCHVGKWHLGEKDFWPERQGFDVNVGGSAAGGPSGGYHLPNKIYPQAKKGEFLTDRLTDDALKFIESTQGQPFFLNFCYYTVHTPIQGKKSYTDYYEKKVTGEHVHQNPIYASMHQSLDESVGRVLDKLDELGIADNTMVFFLSDNGGLSMKFGKETGITNNAPLRRGKGAAYEGGHRVPFAIRWPGVTKEGSLSDVPVCSVDLYPTILAATGVEGNQAHNRTVDGVDLAPLLKRESGLDRDALYWHYPHYHAGGDAVGGVAQGPYGAIRQGEWKLIEFYEEGKLELYNLDEDLSESHDLASKMPAKAKELWQKLQTWRASVDAQMPTPNPNYTPTTKKK